MVAEVKPGSVVGGVDDERLLIDPLLGEQGEEAAYARIDLRDDLGVGQVPFVAGHLGHFVSSPKHDGKYAYSQVVEDHLTALPGRVPCTAVVDSAGLTAKQDELHFDTPSLREFGIRYAAAMRRLHESN